MKMQRVLERIEPDLAERDLSFTLPIHALRAVAIFTPVAADKRAAASSAVRLTEVPPSRIAVPGLRTSSAAF